MVTQASRAHMVRQRGILSSLVPKVLIMKAAPFLGAVFFMRLIWRLCFNRSTPHHRVEMHAQRHSQVSSG